MIFPIIFTILFIGSPLWVYGLISLWGEFVNNFYGFNNKFVKSSGSHGKVTKLKWKTIKSLYKLSRWRWKYEHKSLPIYLNILDATVCYITQEMRGNTIPHVDK